MKNYIKRPKIFKAKKWDGKFDGLIHQMGKNTPKEGYLKGKCPDCGALNKHHGLMLEHRNTSIYDTVCPGDYIVIDSRGHSFAMRPDKFKSEFSEL